MVLAALRMGFRLAEIRRMRPKTLCAWMDACCAAPAGGKTYKVLRRPRR